tara:strand:- start:423 stop:1463 length:1041 start_codon:yes stop_codon:yes gene_type:complete
MARLTKLGDYRCGVCGGTDFLPIDFSSYVMPTESANPAINDFVNHICDGCGVIAPYPAPDMTVLSEHYNSAYRKDAYDIETPNGLLRLPIQIPWSGVSFLRFKSFFDAVERNKARHPDIVPQATDAMIDFGAYQGMFLHAAVQAWGCSGVAYDFNETGISFAKNALGMTESQVAKDIYSDTFARKGRFAVLIHAFEHLQFPDRFLAHLHEKVLEPGGWLYIEVPNAFGFSLADPTHYFTYTTDSLRFLLEKSGFAVADIWIGNYPLLEDEPWSNPQQNIYALCKADPGAAANARPPVASAQEIYKRIRRTYRRLSFEYVMRQLRFVMHHAIRLPVHFWRFLRNDLL